VLFRSHLTTNILSLQRFELLRNPVVVHVQAADAVASAPQVSKSNLSASEVRLGQSSMSISERALVESLIQQTGVFATNQVEPKQFLSENVSVSEVLSSSNLPSDQSTQSTVFEHDILRSIFESGSKPHSVGSGLLSGSNANVKLMNNGYPAIEGDDLDDTLLVL
jgi:hypothetical protein